jgi:hypothetical protein
LRPGAAIVVQSSSGTLETTTLEGPRGLATLGLRPAALIHVIPGEADPSLFHQLPSAAVARREAGSGQAVASAGASVAH